MCLNGLADAPLHAPLQPGNPVLGGVALPVNLNRLATSFGESGTETGITRE